MTASYDKNRAVVVLPAAAGDLPDPSLRRWLARADWSRGTQRRDVLTRVLSALDRSVPTAGIAALRLWGQTGDRPGAWMAAADPVYLEPQLDELRVAALPPGDVDNGELDALIEHLQRTLGSSDAADGGVGFARLGSWAYLTAGTPVPTASAAPSVVHDRVPTAFLPGGEGAGAFRGLLSEIEMALHDHPVNQARQQAGRVPVNSLWIWGGGTAPAVGSDPPPPLYSGDPLLHGYWLSQRGSVSGCPDAIDRCVDQSDIGFVATPAAGQMHAALAGLRRALADKRLDAITLLFADEWRADLTRRHRWRWWRRTLTLPSPERADG